MLFLYYINEHTQKIYIYIPKLTFNKEKEKYSHLLKPERERWTTHFKKVPGIFYLLERERDGGFHLRPSVVKITDLT